MKKTIILCLVNCFLLQNCWAQITFNVCDVKEKNGDIGAVPYTEAMRHAFPDLDGFGAPNASETMVGVKDGNAFVLALAAAYSGHKGIVISPDMVWLMICQGFSAHVRANSDSLRHKIVDFEGKKTLTIHNDNMDWEKHFPKFCDSLQTYIGDSLRLLMSPTFSTTNAVATAAFQVTLMEAMTPYFDYEDKMFCGIPHVTLTGKPSDWKWILAHINDFDKYEMSWWTKELRPILQQFYNASRGKIDTPFWQSIFSISEDCGFPMSGWCINFFPYLTNYENKLDRNYLLGRAVLVGDFAGGIAYENFPNGCAKAPVKLFVLENPPIDIEFIAGFVGYSQNENKDIVPEINWVVRKKSN